MLIYQSEIDDGVSEELAIASVSATCEIAPSAPRVELALATNLNQPDLHYNKSLLVRTGFNKNSDFFTAKDTWLARKTPIDKLVDIEHNREMIIGHQTDAVCVDDEGNEIDEVEYAKADTYPESFSIIDTDVLYLIRGTKERTEQMQGMLDEIVAGKWWVSMEAKFANFDYVLVPYVQDATKSDMSKAEFIERTEKTAHLSKYLAVYNKKANNTYEGKRIGRVLRDITFAGKGYVRVPANPTSAVYTFNGIKLSNFAKANQSIKNVVYNNSDPIKDAITMNEIEKLKADLEVANKNLVTATEAKEKAEHEAEEAKKNVVVLEAKNLETEKALEAEKVKVVETEKVLNEANAKLNEIASEKRFGDLVVKVKKAYNVDEAKANELALTLKGLDDKAIDANLTAVASMKLAVVTPIEKPAKEEPPVVALLVEAPAEVVVAAVVPTPTEADLSKARVETAQAELSNFLKKTKKAPKGK